jgi:nucleoside-diphosphate-sugar epimerase
MKKYPDEIAGIEQLEDMISTPTEEVIEYFTQMTGDILMLGVGGKIGPSLALMAKKASRLAGNEKRIIGVSSFSSTAVKDSLEKNGIETLRGDLMDKSFLESLPDVENVIFLAGMKFGSTENISLTWAINSYLPGLVADRFPHSKIIVYSTGCVYPFVNINTGGATELIVPKANGEYAQSALGRERMFEYGSRKHNTPVTIIRLNYAVEMRYGVLLDIAKKVKNQIPIDLEMGWANVIWQGDANAIVLRSFEICDSPPEILNVTGPETMSLQWAAQRFGEIYNMEPIFTGAENDTAWINNAAKSQRLFGYPKVALDQLVMWTARWVENDLLTWDKPTHFETRDGKY